MTTKPKTSLSDYIFITGKSKQKLVLWKKSGFYI